MTLLEQLTESSDYIRMQVGDKLPIVAIQGGTGQDHLLAQAELILQISYADIPHVPNPTVKSHAGSLVLARIEEHLVWVIQGRLHAYEGHTMNQICHLVRTLKWMGCQTFFLTNVTGGINSDYSAGQLVLVRDHINLHKDSPLTGPNDEHIGPRFPDMSSTYSARLRAIIHKYAERVEGLATPLAEGVYASVPGPQLETPAEYRYLHQIGADLVGMSTVPEVIALRHMDAEVVVLSMVSNECHPDQPISETTLESVIAVAREQEPVISEIIHLFIKHQAAE